MAPVNYLIIDYLTALDYLIIDYITAVDHLILDYMPTVDHLIMDYNNISCSYYKAFICGNLRWLLIVYCVGAAHEIVGYHPLLASSFYT